MKAPKFSILLALAATLAAMGLVLILLLGLAGTGSVPAYASPGVLYVAPGGNCGGETPCHDTVQNAVDAAQAGDEIRVAAGIYPIQAGSDQVVSVDKNVTIRGGYTPADWDTSDPEANPTELNALAQGRVMVITTGASVTVEGLRLTFGNAAGLGGHPGDDAGGGLYVSQARAALRQTWILSSTVPDGLGGVSMSTRAHWTWNKAPSGTM